MSYYFNTTETREVSEFDVKTFVFVATYAKTFPAGTYLPPNLTLVIAPHANTKWDVEQQIWVEDVCSCRERKKELFRQQAKQLIEEPFYSEALGARYLYDCREEDQSNIALQWVSTQGSMNLRQVYCHDGVEWVARDHDNVQLTAVIKDMEKSISDIRVRLYTAVSKLNAATTIAEVEDVIF